MRRRRFLASGLAVRVAYAYGVETEASVVGSRVETAAYYVDAVGALRAHGAAGGGELATDLDPVAAGEPVVCF